MIQKIWCGAGVLAVPANSWVMVPSHTSSPIEVTDLRFLPAVTQWRASDMASFIILYWWMIRNTTTSYYDFSLALAKFDGYPRKFSTRIEESTLWCIHLLICQTNISWTFHVPGIVLDTRDTAWLRHTWPLPLMFMCTMEKTLFIVIPEKEVWNLWE